MSAAVGIGREADGLGGVGALAHGLRRRPVPASTPTTRAGVEAANLALVSAAVVAAATAREESLGSHVRTDGRASARATRTPRSHRVTLVDDRLHVDRVLSGRRHDGSPAMTAGPLTVLAPDPAAVVEAVRVALAEDLRYGPDATTEATVRGRVRALASITPREPGVLAGGPVALAVFRAVLGEDLRDPAGRRRTVRAAGAGRARAAARRTRPRPPDRRAHRAEPDQPAVRGGHRSPGPGWTRWPAPARGSGTPARPFPACGRCRSTPCVAVAGSITGSGWATPA